MAFAARKVNIKKAKTYDGNFAWFFNGPIAASLCSFLHFQQYVVFLSYWWLDSNQGPPVSEATGLPTVPQQLPNCPSSFRALPSTTFMISHAPWH